MKHESLPVAATTLILLLAGLTAAAEQPLSHQDQRAAIPTSGRDVVYCQDPDYIMIYNMSSGFDAEIADDIPAELAGTVVTSLTLWFGEWYSGGSQGWRDPVGLRVNFYHESCPPELDPYQTIEIAWADLDRTLVESSSSRWVYEVRVPLSPGLVVEPGMSLGATALIDWGTDEPFCGIVATPFFVSYGACPAYLDGENWGYIRWTAIDHVTNIAQDLAYCLSTDVTPAPDLAASGLELGASPNPFNPRTTIHFTVPEAGHVELAIWDLAGRMVRTLMSGPSEAGRHDVRWDGVDQAGRHLPAGAYVCRLTTSAGSRSQTVTLLK